MKTGQIVGQTLKLYGVKYFFGLPGGDYNLWLGLREAGIEFILTHSERAGVAMADGYSRLTGRPAVAYGQWGVGAALCVSGIADAYLGHSAVVCLTSSISSGSLYRYAYQGIDDQLSLFDPVTTWNARVPGINRLPDMLRTAFRRAVSGIPGPVHIDIPQELTRTMEVDLPDVQLYADEQCKKYPAYRVAPEPQDVEKAVKIIAGARKPLILAGGGVIMSEAWGELIEFAESLSIPVVTSASGKPAIPTAHPLAVGTPGNYSSKVANDVVTECDTYIVIGSNLGDMTTQGWRLPTPSTRIIQVDMNPDVLGANLRTACSFAADAKLALKAMLEAAEASGLTGKAHPWDNWVREVQSKVSTWKADFADKAKDGGPPGSINPYFVMAALNRILTPADVVVADTGYMAAYGSTLIDVKTPGRTYTRATGSLGYGLPLALGAQLAVQDKGRVICLMGDGGMGYHVPEMETAVRLNLPVVVVVMNNSSLAFVHHTFKLKYKSQVPEVNDYLDIDYAAVARTFHAYGERVENAEEVEPALVRALNSGQPAVVDLAIDREIYAPVATYEGIESRLV